MFLISGSGARVALKRDLGAPLPFKMLSPSQKSEDNPFYEAILEDAATTDPILKARPGLPPNSTLHLGFYDPCHVRYTRRTIPGQTGYVALYLCPVSAAKSRVFLFNIFESAIPNTSPKSKRQRIKEWMSLSSIQQKVKLAIFRRIFTPVVGHMMSHKIFDGDGIFLHKQGHRMQREGLTYLDYSTPAAADVLVNAFRRYLNTACKATRQAGKDSVADAANASLGYDDNLARSQMLDRYESHTKNCKVCSEALEAKQRRMRRLEFAETALTGAFGASSMSLVGILVLSYATQIGVPAALIRIAALAVTTTFAASYRTSKIKTNVEKQIQQFYFEDYVHSEKD